MLKTNRKHRIIVDIDATRYISNDETSVISNITKDIYEKADSSLGGQHKCHVTAKIVEHKYIVIAFESVYYQE